MREYNNRKYATAVRESITVIHLEILQKQYANLNHDTVGSITAPV